MDHWKLSLKHKIKDENIEYRGLHVLQILHKILDPMSIPRHLVM